MTDVAVPLRGPQATVYQLVDYGDQNKHVRAMPSAASVDLAWTLSLPAALPAVKLTRCLTQSPASATVSFVVTLAASSPAGRRCIEACASASFRAGPSSDNRDDRTCRAFSDHPLSTTREGGRKTLHASVQKSQARPGEQIKTGCK